MKEKKRPASKTRCTPRVAAVEEGILPGGGVALLRATGSLKPEGLTHGPRMLGLQHRDPCFAALPLTTIGLERRPGRRHRLPSAVPRSQGEQRFTTRPPERL